MLLTLASQVENTASDRGIRVIQGYDFYTPELAVFLYGKRNEGLVVRPWGLGNIKCASMGIRHFDRAYLCEMNKVV